MSSELSIFAARLREHIGICSSDALYDEPVADPALAAHFDAEFNGLALMLYTLQFKHNLAYRRICEARGVLPDSVTHWSQIPAVPAGAFKELELTSLPADQRTTVFHSSGTTLQKPSRHFHSAESLAIYEASLWPWFRKHLPCANDDLRLAILTPKPAEAPHSSLVHMFDTIRGNRGESDAVFCGKLDELGGWTMNFPVMERAFRDAIVNQQPLLLLGTAFSFVHMLDFLAEQHLTFELPPGSTVMETGGYKGRSRALPKPELHAWITARLGIPPSHIVCEYGMSELSSQAYDGCAGAVPDANRNNRTFQFPPWARARIISPETGREVAEGETGLIRIFDLANIFSVMALQTEDLAIRRGARFELVGRAKISEPRGCSLMTAEL